MKKTLSLILSLMMIITTVCTVPFTANADGDDPQPPATIDSVSVNPSSVTLSQRAGYQFNASVEGTEPDKSVTWSVEGAQSASTTISDTGFLNVDSEETADTFTVKATAVMDNTKYATATVTVTALDRVNSVSINFSEKDINLSTQYTEGDVTNRIKKNVTTSDNVTLDDSNSELYYLINTTPHGTGDGSASVSKDKNYYICTCLELVSGYEWISSLKSVKDEWIGVNTVDGFSIISNGVNRTDAYVKYNSYWNSLFVLLPVETVIWAAEPAVKVVRDDFTVHYSAINGNNITSALKDAFNYIREHSANNKKFTVNVPAGNYNVETSLMLPSNTTVNLKGVKLTTIKTNIFYSDGNYYGYNGLHDLTVNDGELTYPSGSTNEACLVRICHSKNVRFNRTKFSNNYMSHHVEVAGSYNTVFDSCVFEGQTADIKKGSAEALQIDILDKGEHFKGMGEDKYYDGTMNNYFTVSNCTFNNVVRGVGTHSSFQGKYQSNIKIVNNTFTNIRATAITCFNFINTTVTGNKISKCGQGILFYMMQNDKSIDLTVTSHKGAINKNCNSVIANNNISVIKTKDFDDPSPIYVFGNTVNSSKSKKVAAGNYLVGNIKVQNNTVSTPYYGIRLFDTINSVVSGNTVNTTDSKNQRQGIIINDKCNKVTVSSNKINKFKQGISIEDSSNCVVQSNTVTSPSEHGVMLKSSNGTYVRSNTVNKPGKTGVTSSGSKNSHIISNKVVSPGSHGFSFIYKANDAELTGNTATSVGGNGLYVNDDSYISSVKSNYLSGAVKHGICLFGKSGTVSGNTFASNKGWGFYIAPGANASAVYPNTYSSNKKGKGYAEGSKYKFANLKKTSVKLSSKKKSVTVKWKKVDGATKYNVYRSTSKNSGYKKVKTVKGTSFTNKKLKKGKVYYFKVVAIKSKKGITQYSADSAVKSIKCK